MSDATPTPTPTAIAATATPDALRLTTAQALVRFLVQQHVERDGRSQPLFAGCFGIFGHGNLAGIGQALQETPQLRYFQARNE